MKFSKEKLIALLGVTLIILGIFLPFFTANALGIKKVNVNYFDIHGLYLLIGMIICVAAYLFLKNKKFAYNIPSVLCGLLMVLVMYDGFIGNKDIRNQLQGLGGVKLNIGFYFIVVGLVLFLLGIILDSRQNSEVKIEKKNETTNPNINNGETYESMANQQTIIPEQELNAPIPEIGIETVSQEENGTEIIEPVTEPVQTEVKEIEIIEPVTESAQTEVKVEESTSVEEDPLKSLEQSEQTFESIFGEPMQEEQPQNRFFTNPTNEESENKDDDDNLSNNIFNF